MSSPLTRPSPALSASDLLRRPSGSDIFGAPIRAVLANTRPGRAGRGGLRVSAKIKKWKKHDYPWPDEVDPGVKGGPLSYLSHFKPLKEKPKPVTLDFEKPLRDLERKIIDVRKMADETGLDFSDQIISLESKYQQALKDLYTRLTPIQRLSIARHPNRPTFLDHVLNITDKWVELHGDRAGYDDPAIVTGIGSIDGRSYMFIGHQKGRNTKENIQRNFGMPTPHGYRKALRMMYYANRHQMPIITFIDTPGAFADLKSEELGQGEAIAHNLRSMYGLKVPIVTVVIGEGGSGGALAIGCANKILMLENAVFFVASPEACAAILWKSAKAAPKAAEKLRITSTELCKLKIADGIIPFANEDEFTNIVVQLERKIFEANDVEEPLGGAHLDPSWTSQQIKLAVIGAMNELLQMDTQTLLDHRMHKFRRLGGFQEGIPQDPKKKVNMKKKEEPIAAKDELGSISDLKLDEEIEKLKQQMLNSAEILPQQSDIDLNEVITKLKREVDREFAEAVKSLGLQDKFEALRKEVIKARTVGMVDSDFAGKIDELKQELNNGLSEAPNATSLNYKLDMLKQIVNAKKLSEQNEKAVMLKQEINKRLKEAMDKSGMRERIEMLNSERSNGGISAEGVINDELRDKVAEVKKDIELELIKVLKDLQLDVHNMSSGRKSDSDFNRRLIVDDLKVKIDELNEEINEQITEVVNSSDLKNKMELLKLEVAKAGNSPDAESKNKIEALKRQIKEQLAGVVGSSGLAEKHEKLREEFAGANELPVDSSSGSPDQEAAVVEGQFQIGVSRV